ncbi:MAG TPA: hemolysin family protein [Candidatus Polarisedimenticolia bacterium]|jgi:CBS domain containing-hemolysin-like protein|nr:hemolysin family protein [Candidatus Polarisedimenticolia bacterium]
MTSLEISIRLCLAAVLVMGNAFFVAAEFAIVRVRPTRIRHLEQSGDHRARIAAGILHHLDEYLSACQLGITIVSLGLGWIGKDAFAPLFAALFSLMGIAPVWVRSASMTSAFALITVVHIILGELVPKSAAIRRPGRSALRIALPLRLFYVIFYPILFLMNRLSMLSLRVLGIKPGEREIRQTEEELRMVLTESTHHGILSPAEMEIMHRATRFSDRRAQDVMVSRARTVVWDSRRPVEENLMRARKSGHTRYPVADAEGKRFVGVINIKDLAWLTEAEWVKLDLDRFLRAIVTVSPRDPIDAVIREMRRRRIHIAAVEDQGQAIGILTMEDIIEEIFGEIQDEFEPSPSPA